MSPAGRRESFLRSIDRQERRNRKNDYHFLKHHVPVANSASYIIQFLRLSKEFIVDKKKSSST